MTAFKPKHGQRYYEVNLIWGTVERNENLNWPADKAKIGFGNCFRTKREAELALKRVLKALKG